MMQDAEQLTQQQIANQFWQTHFSDLLNTPINEPYAIEINLWKRLQDVFATQDKDTLRAVALTKITLPIQSTNIALRIMRLAKQAIDTINNKAD